MDNTKKSILQKTTDFKIGDTMASKIMQSPVITIMPSFSIKSTIETFRNHHISSAPVVNDQGVMIGIISEYDLLLQSASLLLSDSISYTANVKTVTAQNTLKEVLILLFKNKLKHIPVVDEKNYPIGIISRIDVLGFISDNELKN